MSTQPQTVLPGSGSILRGHPPGLRVLFLTEMWADFSYFGMRALLVYYMTKQLGFSFAAAATLYGLYTAGAHFTPILGGLVADRLLGRRMSVTAGAAIMATGHFMMAFPSLFFPALVTIAAGFGLFLPSLPGQVGDLYSREDPRRDRAYSIYYVGINLGSFLAPLTCGTLGEIYGWHYGFAAAGVGMLAGLVIYLRGGRYLPPDPRPVRHPSAPGSGLLRELRPMAALLVVLGVGVILFRCAYEQIGNSLALWADQGIDRRLIPGSSFVIPMTWFQSFNPLYIFAATPLLLRLWKRQERRGIEAGPAAKMSLGSALLGAGYLILAVGALWSAGQPAPWLLFAVFILVLTLAELHFIPIGLSLVSAAAPAEHKITMLGGWFLLAFFGNLLAGLLASVWTRLTPGPFFIVCTGVCVASCALLFAFRHPLNRLSDRDQPPARPGEPRPEPVGGRN